MTGKLDGMETRWLSGAVPEGHAGEKELDTLAYTKSDNGDLGN